MKNKKFLKKSVRGSFSIEAAFILPMFLTVIFSLIYLSFFLYNNNILQQELYRKAFLKAKEESGEITEKKFLSIGKIQEKEEIIGKNITMYGKVQMKVPINNFLTKTLISENWILSNEKSAKRIEPVSFIRKCRILEMPEGEDS